ncbi:MAG: phosphogluconate dehydrogenase (NAD(+)-dependent, decarboxylating) [Bacteroidota bacterium]
MELGLIGLGRMGLNMTIRMLRGGHRVVVHNRSQGPVETAQSHGADAAASMADFVSMLDAPRVVWLMLPAGQITDDHLTRLHDILDEGDLIVEGANSRYTDTIRRAREAAEHGLHFVDAGVSGGIWGLENGYSTMVGGTDEAVARVAPVIETLAPGVDKGWGHVGPVGSGHYVKMVHNGVEYAMMQAFAEGFAMFDKKSQMGDNPVDFDLHQIAEVWRYGSVVQSWLLDLTAEALKARPGLDAVAPYVPDSGEGRWTVEEAIDLRMPVPTIAQALFERFQSRDERSFAYRLLSAMRGSFGGHAVKGMPEAGGLNDDGTIEIIPGGIQTEGATTR